jgi:glucose/arabinose dehydrogenase
MTRSRLRGIAIVAALGALLAGRQGPAVQAQTPPSVLDPNLSVRTVVSGLSGPIGMAFINKHAFFVIEKATGQVKLVVDGKVAATVLDLPVNSASERGLLSIALHPDFPRDRGVYLYWTESSTGADSTNLAEVGNPNSPFPPGTPVPFGNRVDRFVWDVRRNRLVFDHNLVVLRAFQADDNQPLRGNHDGGVIRFGVEDHRGRGRGRSKLYVVTGDLGRRGQTQNLPDGPFGPGLPDDQFGGPAPDAAHLTGVVLRLNDDGSIPRDNPFFDVGQMLVAQGQVDVGRSIQRAFAYGIRNSFGLAIDPETGDLWESENGDDSFSEINRVFSGFNGGWVQIMGPVARIAQFKAIETGNFPGFPNFFGLQQVRWLPTNIADTPEEALARLFDLPGSEYSDPVLSWRFEVAPAGLEFLDSSALGREYRGDLFVGASTPVLEGGYLFRLDLNEDRDGLDLSDPRLDDGVADNLAKHEITESESLLFGRNFGVGTQLLSGPNGNLFVVSLTTNAVYEIGRKKPPARHYLARLTGSEEVPSRQTRAQGAAFFELQPGGQAIRYHVVVANLRNPVAAHIHVGPAGANGPVTVSLFGPAPPGGGTEWGVLARGTITADDLVGPLADRPLSALLDEMMAGNTYVNVHTNDGNTPPDTGPGDFPGGEIRGQVRALGPD